MQVNIPLADEESEGSEDISSYLDAQGFKSDGYHDTGLMTINKDVHLHARVILRGTCFPLCCSLCCSLLFVFAHK